MDRRTFIGSVAVLIGGAGSYLYLLDNNNDILSNYINSLSGMDQLGLDYIKQHPETSDFKKQLSNQIGKPENSQQLNNKIKQLINRDYQQYNLCEVDGWLLSETECLLAACYVTHSQYTATRETSEKTFLNAKTEDFMTIKNWGPKKTLKGEVFNKQSDGHAGIWVAVENPPPNIKMYINGQLEATFTSEKSITSGIHNLKELDDFINTLGKSEIALYDDINHRKQVLGFFEVLPVPKKLIYPDGVVSASFCPIESWGPKQAKKGVAFNKQPNGHAAIWIKTKCSSKTTKVWINDTEMTTTIHHDLITASININKINSDSGYYKVELRDKNTNENLSIGKITLSETNPEHTK